ncbi:membrane protein [Mycobacterium haemophilum]|uniref:Membrane protein n=1 Tax=Mycobacterium haemophilum TaxID=29311 RepID=A0A0I9Y0E1_9MYCO|nr:membrane protein [Mycobacterium haemophilum]KLO37240.1 membrane protein [Mycobacterium haemophilum]KLO43713.1 membrane protein [Mycobacterium haemophilum]KLO56070.1 membrane protein [Mycobacterium haemophilum]
MAITTGLDGGDPLRATPLRWRSPRGLMVVTRCAQLRCAGDHHGA